MKRFRNAARILAAALGLAFLAAAVAVAEVDDCPDAWITTKITSKLLAKGMVHVDVETEVCAVTMTGCVKTEEKRQKAQKAAENTKYVKSVDNQIVICSKSDDADRAGD